MPILAPASPFKIAEGIRIELSAVLETEAASWMGCRRPLTAPPVGTQTRAAMRYVNADRARGNQDRGLSLIRRTRVNAALSRLSENTDLFGAVCLRER
jgi:hypothetical protein